MGYKKSQKGANKASQPLFKSIGKRLIRFDKSLSRRAPYQVDMALQAFPHACT